MPRVKRNIQDGYNTLFAKRLRKLIEDNNITQNQLSGILGKTRQAINNYTLGNTAPDADTLIKLSEYFNVSVDYLIGVSNVKTIDKDIKFICDYTGLSENAVKKLHLLKIESVQGYIESDIEIKGFTELVKKKIIEDEEMINSTKRDAKELLDLLSKLIEDGKHNIFDVIIELELYLKKLDSDLRLYNFVNENAETKMKENFDNFFETLGLLSSCTDKRRYMLFCINREFQNVIDLLSDEKEKRIEELERELLNKVDTFAHLEGDINGND